MLCKPWPAGFLNIIKCYSCSLLCPMKSQNSCEVYSPLREALESFLRDSGAHSTLKTSLSLENSVATETDGGAIYDFGFNSAFRKEKIGMLFSR